MHFTMEGVVDKSSVQNRNQIIRERTHSTVLIKKIDMKLRMRIKRATHEDTYGYVYAHES
jgi:hypothetical protein